jgi:serine/threonine protein kinase
VVEVRDYTLLDTLGTGATGVVYRARHNNLAREVALKTVLVPGRAAAEVRARFEHEARSLARLQHPNIVTVFDSGPCERPAGYNFIAMELLEGETLDEALARGPLPETAAWFLARQVVSALAEADKHQIVHRDIKPSNLFLAEPPAGVPFPEGAKFVKVTDFGLALAGGVGVGDDARAGTVVGTPLYMAPEQAAGGIVDRRADIYALGATVFQARAGKVPFDGRTVGELAQQKALEPPVLPNGTPEETELLKRMMARDPADRPQTYDELLRAIDALPCLADALPPGSGSGRHKVAAPPMPQPTPPGAVVPVTPPAPVTGTAPCPPEPPCLRTRALQLASVLALGLALGAGIAYLAGAFGQ